MGVRLYDPSLGRFLQTHSIAGGNATPYDYCAGDPINCTDLDGRWGWFKRIVKKAVKIVTKVADYASNIPGPIGSGFGFIAAGGYAAQGNWKAAAWAAGGALANTVGAGWAVRGLRSTVSSSRIGARISSGFNRVFRGGGCNSFAASTPVLMADGNYIAISEIREGDSVIATDPLSGVSRPEPVLQVIVGQGTKEIVEIDFDDRNQNRLEATAGHPLWIIDRGWVEAGDVNPGDSVYGLNGARSTVRTVSHRGHIDDQTVFNLNVGNLHTFTVLVGDIDVLTHNRSNASCPITARPSNWRTGVAADVLATSGRKCTTCGTAIGGRIWTGKRFIRDWHVDHIYKVRKIKKRDWRSRKAFLNAYYHRSNLRARCIPCNVRDNR